MIFYARSFSIEVSDMSSSVLIAVLLAAIVFVVYLRVSGLYQVTDSFVSEKIPEMPEPVVSRQPPAPDLVSQPPQQRRLP